MTSLYGICLATAIAVFLAGVCYSAVIFSRNRKTGGKPAEYLTLSVFISSALMFVPLYADELSDDKLPARIFKTVLLSVHNAVRLFVVDGDFESVKVAMHGKNETLSLIYSLFAAILFFLAAMITFSTVLIVILKAFHFKRARLYFASEIHIFSELNAKSLALAKSIKSKNDKAAIVFTDVYDKNDEQTGELLLEVKELGADTFVLEQDVAAFDFTRYKKGALIFYLIGEDDEENISQAIQLERKYRDDAGVKIYLFSDSVESEMLHASLSKGLTGVSMRRIDDVESLIFRMLHRDGNKLFENAMPYPDHKKIRIVLVGLGRYGKMMLRTLSWFCQMNGYFAQIDVFDADKHATEDFRSLCPELLDERYNRFELTENDARYLITIHDDTDVNGYAFDREIKKISNATYVFVALGNDEMNIRIATKLRRIYEGLGIHPQIQAIVYNHRKNEIMKNFGVGTDDREKLDIDFIGDLKTIYDESILHASELEQRALKIHQKWGGDEESFWRVEYNYRSSVSRAIHDRIKTLHHVPGIGKKKEDMTPEEKAVLAPLEHRRWNAYMRSEGFTWARARNNVARQHPNLVPFDELPESEREKDL